jgi:hypothetical protein
VTAAVVQDLAVLRDGETRVDHAHPGAPRQGPLTMFASLLTLLSWEQLRCLNARMCTVTADSSALRWHPDGELAAGVVADLAATWDEAQTLSEDIVEAEYAVLTRGAR